MSAAVIYEPSKALHKRVARRIAPFQQKQMVEFNINRPIVSFTFDDCPKSAVENGLSKLDRLGWKSTIYIAPKLFGTTNHLGLHMDETDVIAAHESGHEIGGHSFSHMDLSEMPLASVLEDIAKNHRAINSLNLPRCRTFAYPYGQTTAALKRRLSKEYEGLRGISPGPMLGKFDLNQIRSTPLFSGSSFDNLMRQIADIKDQNSWLSLFTHDIQDSPSKWGCTPDEMDCVIKAVEASGAEVLTVSDAIAKLRANTA